MPIYDTDLEDTKGTQLHFFIGVVIETFFAARFSRRWARSYRVQVTRQYLKGIPGGKDKREGEHPEREYVTWAGAFVVVPTPWD